MSNEPYNPNSIDAQLARIIANQEAAKEDREKLFKVLDRHDKKITNLEKWRTYVIGISTAVGVGIQHGFDGVKKFLSQ